MCKEQNKRAYSVGSLLTLYYNFFFIIDVFISGECSPTYNTLLLLLTWFSLLCTFFFLNCERECKGWFKKCLPIDSISVYF